MSAELIFKIKKKGLKPDTAPDLLFLCTTPARELASEIDFVFCGKSDDEYDGWTVLSMDKLNAIINFYSDKLDEIDRSITRMTAEVEDYKAQMPRAISLELYKEMRDERDEVLSWIAETNDELDEYTRWKNDFIMLKSIITDYGNRDFEIIYYYC